VGVSAIAAEGAVAATNTGELTSEAAGVLRTAKRVAKASSVVSAALAVDEIATGDTALDRGHGVLTLAVTVGGIACGASGVCAAAVITYGVLDTAVQFKEYTDPETGQHYSGWSAIYKDAVD